MQTRSSRFRHSQYVLAADRRNLTQNLPVPISRRHVVSRRRRKETGILRNERRSKSFPMRVRPRAANSFPLTSWSAYPTSNSWRFACTLHIRMFNQRTKLKTIEGETHEGTTYDIRFRWDRVSVRDRIVRAASEDRL